MDNEIRLLASARAGVDELKAELAEVEQKIAKSPLAVLRAQLKKRLTDMRDIRDDLDAQIRRAALNNYRKTGHKLPHPAVTVWPTHDNRYSWSSLLDMVRIKEDLSAYLNKEDI